MVEGGGGPAFPVAFYDGEREMNIGNVNINPSLGYKTFQLMLSQRIGISPNQISIYLVDRKKSPSSPFTDERRRLPITGKVNFATICRQKDCYFLVVLKRSRKSRNRKERIINGRRLEFSDSSPENEYSPPSMHPVPENLILLRRNQPPFCDQITGPELADINYRLQSLRFHRENYQTAMAKGIVNSPGIGSGHGFDLNKIPIVDPFPTLDDLYQVPVPTNMIMTTKNGTQKIFCEDCENSKDGDTTSFHPCVNDAVVTRLTKRLKPISRPHKQRLESFILNSGNIV